MKIRAIGLDWGNTVFLTGSNGHTFDLPKNVFLRTWSQIFKWKQKRKKSGSQRKKANRVLRDMDQRIIDYRQKWARRLVERLLTRYDLICLEDVVVPLYKGEPKNCKQLRAKWAVDYWYEFIYQLKNAVDADPTKTLIFVNIRGTSRVCSFCNEKQPRCATKKEKFALLKSREFDCVHCGVSLDRDVNAAINILKRGMIEYCADVADMGRQLLGKESNAGSNPVISTINKKETVTC